MGLLIDGVWKDQWYDTKSSGGDFVRGESIGGFRGGFGRGGRFRGGFGCFGCGFGFGPFFDFGWGWPGFDGYDPFWYDSYWGFGYPYYPGSGLSHE